ncbi:hypothetical protein AB4Y77_11630 [Paenarthrobacter sp. YAF11_1]|uniref:hypothetical protein n=1 Tax=Paenarthrobacter sp. YAF11_1 TaxID=3233074 RepID=UPI003F95360A
MSGPLFLPDNTVLVNFARIGRMDLLELVAAGRSTWCYTVAQECAKSSRVTGLEQLSRAPQIFGEPLMLETTSEYRDTQAFRAQLSKPGDRASANLGEAESLAIITNRGLGATFVTDDNGALGFAITHSIKHLTTWDLLKLLVRAKKLGREDAWDYVVVLKGHHRRYMELRAQTSFFAWLESPLGLRYIP